MRINYTLILTLILVVSCSLSRQKLIQNFNKSTTGGFEDSVLKKLQSKSSLLIILNRLSAHSMIKKDYKILSLQQNKWHAIQYFVKDVFTSNEKAYDYIEKEISNILGDSVFHIFTTAKFWEIEDVDNGCKKNEYKNSQISCTNGGGSAPVYEITFVSKIKRSIKNYFNPEFYETECCPGNKDRQVFIKCLNAINSLFKN